MGEFYILPVHAAQALGVRVDQLNLPKSQYGVDGDALWVDPRFIEVRRQREVIARQLERHRNNLHPDLQHKPRSTEEKLALRREEARARRRARQHRRKAMRAAAASI
jgi:hypothetical protein